MGPLAAQSALHVLELLEDVVAIELMVAAQGADFHLDDGASLGRGTTEVHRIVRSTVDRWESDRVMHTDLRLLGACVRSGALNRQLLLDAFA